MPKVSNSKKQKLAAAKSGRVSIGEGRAAWDAEAAGVVEAAQKLAHATSSLSEEQRELLSKGFGAFKQSRVCGCSCSGCAAAAESGRAQLEPKMWGAQGTLKNVPELRAELLAHGKSVDKKNKSDLLSEIRELEQANALRLTIGPDAPAAAEAAAAEPSDETPESPARTPRHSLVLSSPPPGTTRR